mgnify:CR=1 FL=1|jgi:hypothetical protein
MSGVPPPKPIPLKDRAALVFVERAQIDVLDGAFVPDTPSLSKRAKRIVSRGLGNALTSPHIPCTDSHNVWACSLMVRAERS